MDLGALPGELLSKIEGQIGPLIDLVGIDKVQNMIAMEQLEIVPMGFIRGRSFADSKRESLGVIPPSVRTPIKTASKSVSCPFLACSMLRLTLSIGAKSQSRGITPICFLTVVTG